jgi:hypothetical protein
LAAILVSAGFAVKGVLATHICESFAFADSLSPLSQSSFRVTLGRGEKIHCSELLNETRNDLFLHVWRHDNSGWEKAERTQQRENYAPP